MQLKRTGSNLDMIALIWAKSVSCIIAWTVSLSAARRSSAAGVMVTAGVVACIPTNRTISLCSAADVGRLFGRGSQQDFTKRPSSPDTSRTVGLRSVITSVPLLKQVIKVPPRTFRCSQQVSSSDFSPDRHFPQDNTQGIDITCGCPKR